MFDKIQQIQIETTTACPAKCIMCPLDIMDRDGGRMETDLFHSLIDQVLTLDIPILFPFLNGEPFADNRMMSFLEYFKVKKQELGAKTKLAFFSNMYLLDLDKIEHILINYHDDIDSFFCSLNASTEDTYNKVMGLNGIDDTVLKIRHLNKINQDNHYGIKTGVVFVEQQANRHEKQEYMEMMNNPVCCNPFIAAEFNWAGWKSEYIGNPVHPCHRMLNDMTILWDGRVNLCCMDNEGQVILGDANVEPIIDIWNGFQEKRDINRSLDWSSLQLCNVCNMVEKR